ncbi:MAG: hypothetical protein C0485_04280 [Pirellula sp.]|nr:hypothetical protein [Pirellula sp.]
MMRLSLALGSLIGLFTSTTQAAPLRYRANLVAEALVAPHPLKGASLQLDLTWDAAPLTPISSSAEKTAWPSTNTQGSMTVSGSPAADGVYPASFPSPTLPWTIYNDFAGVGDAIWFPAMRFQIGESRVDTSVLIVRLAETFFSGQHPFYPKPVSYSDATWSKVNFAARKPLTPLYGVDAVVVSASIVAVPEPSTAAMSGLALADLAGIRRRK